MNKSLLLPFVLCLTASCLDAEDDRPAPSGAKDDVQLPTLEDVTTRNLDSRNSVATGACTTGEVKECRIYLPTQNEIQPCFVGEQICEESLWGECGNAVLVDANDEDAHLSAEDLSD